MSFEKIQIEEEAANLAVWTGAVDYELRIDGEDLASVLQAFAAECENGRDAYILESLMDSVHWRLGNAILTLAARGLTTNVEGTTRGPDSANSAVPAAKESCPSTKRIVRLFGTGTSSCFPHASYQNSSVDQSCAAAVVPSNIRIRRDGVRELKVDDEIHEIPHDHELAPNAVFPVAWREQFFVNPQYMSVSRSDMACANAFVMLAAAQDLSVMRDRLPDEIVTLLDQAVHSLKSRAVDLASTETVQHLEQWIADTTTPSIQPSIGPEYEDAVWYDGTSYISDDEIDRNLPDELAYEVDADF
jgi:hypothetical protein